MSVGSAIRDAENQPVARAAIEMSHISKSFPGVRALNDVSFSCAPGEVHAHAEERNLPLARKIFKRLRRAG